MMIVLGGASYASWMPVFCVVSRVGIAALFTQLYVVNSELFPTLFAPTAMGMCNLVARIATILAPQIAEMPGNMPMVLYSLLCFGGIVLSTMLKCH